MKYFAYGSNMSYERLLKRCPSAVAEEVVVISKYSLRFHKPSVDGTGKADCYYTGKVSDKVYGVIYDISDKDDILKLDAAEGCGKHYERRVCKVRTLNSNKRRAVQVYVALIIDTKLNTPSKEYKQYLVQGAEENDLPTAYIAMISSAKTIACKRPLYSCTKVYTHQTQANTAVYEPISVQDTTVVAKDVEEYVLTEDESAYVDEGYLDEVLTTVAWELGIDEWTTIHDRTASQVQIYHVNGTLLRTYYDASEKAPIF